MLSLTGKGDFILDQLAIAAVNSLDQHRQRYLNQINSGLPKDYVNQGEGWREYQELARSIAQLDESHSLAAHKIRWARGK